MAFRHANFRHSHRGHGPGRRRVAHRCAPRIGTGSTRPTAPPPRRCLRNCCRRDHHPAIRAGRPPARARPARAPKTSAAPIGVRCAPNTDAATRLHRAATILWLQTRSTGIATISPSRLSASRSPNDRHARSYQRCARVTSRSTRGRSDHRGVISAHRPIDEAERTRDSSKHAAASDARIAVVHRRPR